MLNRFLQTSIAISLLIAPLSIAAQEEGEEPEAPNFSRRGYYLGLGGTYVQQLARTPGTPGGGELRIENPEIDGLSLKDALLFEGFDLAGALDDRPGIGVSGLAGYRFTPRMAMEVQVEWVNGLTPTVVTGLHTVDNNGVPLAELSKDEGRVVDADLIATTVNGKFFLATNRVQPFALFGLGMAYADMLVGARLAAITEAASVQAAEDRPGSTVATTLPLLADELTPVFDFSGTGFALRAGGGVDVYLTEEVAVNLQLTYLRPFFDDVQLDVFTVTWGLMYRF